MRSADPSETGCIILFRPRQARFRPCAKVQHAKGAVGLPKPRSARDDDEDHRRRRLIHALGLVYCVILAVAGVWLANEITEMKRIQDCALAGRNRCIPIHVAAHSD
jgi:hypothetical protein